MGFPEIVIVVGVGLLRIGWYVFVAYMLWVIWKKVRHLPG